MLMFMQSPAPAPSFIVALASSLAPVLVPLIGSGVTWLLNRASGVISGWPNPVKQVFYIAFTTGVGVLGSRFGLDISTAGAFASSLFGLGLFHLGKASSGSGK